MDELLGFIVLTGPLFFIVLWMPISLALAVWISRKYIKKKPAIKLVGVVVIFPVVLLLPFADEIAGRIYFNHLCATEAGVKVYQTIELPAEYWDEDGEAKFMNSRGVWDEKILGDRLEWRRETESAVSGLFKIDKRISILYDKKLNQELGARTNFRRYFGWLNTFSPAPNVAESCQNMRAEKLSQRYLMSRVFVKSAD